MSPYFSGASRLIKAELFFLDPRIRKDDIPPHVIPAHAGIQGNESLFWWGVKVNKSGIHVAWMLAFASMTAPPSRHTRACGYPG